MNSHASRDRGVLWINEGGQVGNKKPRDTAPQSPIMPIEVRWMLAYNMGSELPALLIFQEKPGIRFFA